MNTKTVIINGKTITVSRVESVKPIGVRKVYDIEVPAGHNYFANCINVHNCEYHSMLRYYGDKYGQPLLKFNDTFVQYRSRNLLVYPSGPDKRVLRGRTRFFASIDEIGWFDNSADSKKVKTSAREVYDALDQSLLTIRGSADLLIDSGFDDIPHGYSLNVSSPSSKSDKICELVRISANSTSIYGIHRPTWEVNPNLPRNCKSIVAAYQKDPQKAQRNLGAEPPLSASPYISNQEWVSDVIHDSRPNRIVIKQKIQNRKQQGLASKWAEVVKMGKSKKNCMLAIDAGYSSNSFAACVGYLDKYGNINVRLLVEVIPEPGIPLNYTEIFNNLLCPIIENMRVSVVLADRWNSLKLLSDMEALYDLVANQYSLKYKDIGLIKSFLESGMVELPRLKEKRTKVADTLEIDIEGYPKCFQGKPVDHLVMQILTVQDTGTQVNKGDGLTDDLFRALALMTWGLNNEAYDEYMSGPEIDVEETIRPEAFAFSRNVSGGGNSLGTGSARSFGGAIGSLRSGR